MKKNIFKETEKYKIPSYNFDHAYS